MGEWQTCLISTRVNLYHGLNRCSEHSMNNIALQSGEVPFLLLFFHLSDYVKSHLSLLLAWLHCVHRLATLLSAEESSLSPMALGRQQCACMPDSVVL